MFRAGPSALLVVLTLAVGGAALGGAAPRLSERLSASDLVVEGRVARVQSRDHDRVRVAELAVDRVLKGEDRLPALGKTIEVVEMRDRPSSPPLFRAGDHVVAFLSRQSRNSYLDETLGPGRRWGVSVARVGVLADPDAQVAREAADLVETRVSWSRAAGEPDAEPPDRRAWAFDALTAQHSGLVEEGAAMLPEVVGRNEPLAPDEETGLVRAVQRTDLPARIRAALFSAVARAELTSLVPALAAASVSRPEALEAVWDARARLGAPPAPSELDAALRREDPAVREVGATGYARYYPAEAADVLGRALAAEAEPRVRVTMLEALGPVEGRASTETLETFFAEDGELLVRQAAGRVLFERGGEAASASLGRLVYAAAPEGQRHAVALLLALDRPEDEPLLEKIRESHPDEKARELARHGFADGHH